MVITARSENKLSTYIVFFLFLLVTLLLITLLGKIKHGKGFDNNNAIVQKPTQHTALASTTSAMFYGSNIDMSQLLPSSPYYFKDSKGEDLIDLSHRLGINMLRISSVLQAFPDQTPDVLYTKEQWDTVLNKMNSYGMKAVVLAETHSTNKNIYNDAVSNDFLVQMQKYIIDSGVGSNSAVFAIDLKNEPTLDDHNLSIIRQEATMIKQVYPHMQVTVGGWKVRTATDKNGNPVYRWNQPQDAQLLSDIVDFYSPHIYGFDQPVIHSMNNLVGMIKGYLNVLEPIAGDKKILFSEFGSANGDSVSDQGTLGSKELEANTYYAMYQTLTTYGQSNLLGSIAYVLYSRNQFPDSWAILKDSGNYIYPAAYVLQKFSTGTSDLNIPMPYPDAQVPANIVLSEKNNQASESAHVNDMILLSISGVKTNSYMMTITPPGGMDVVQPLQYNSQYGKWYSILKVKKSGNSLITATQLAPLIVPPFIYTTTVSVQ